MKRGSRGIGICATFIFYFQTQFLLFICCLLADILDNAVAHSEQKRMEGRRKVCGECDEAENTRKLGLKRSSHGLNCILRY